MHIHLYTYTHTCVHEMPWTTVQFYTTERRRTTVPVRLLHAISVLHHPSSYQEYIPPCCSLHALNIFNGVAAENACGATNSLNAVATTVVSCQLPICVSKFCLCPGLLFENPLHVLHLLVHLFPVAAVYERTASEEGPSVLV